MRSHAALWRLLGTWAILPPGAAAMIASVPPVQAAEVLFVDDDAPPGGDGLSWNCA